MKRTAIARNPEQAFAWQQRTQQKARESKPKPGKGLRNRTKKRSKEEREYTRLCRIHKANNPFCVPCWDGGMTTPVDDVHHMAGREGDRLCDTSNFLSVCRSCHDWIEANGKEAIERGYSKSRGVLNRK